MRVLYILVLPICLLLISCVAPSPDTEPVAEEEAVAALADETAPVVPTPIPATPTSIPVPTPEVITSTVGTDITKLLPVGDPQHGAELLEAKACSGCHLIGRVGAGPSWKAEIYAGGRGIATRATERWQQAAYTGEATSATEYLFESIVMPNEYVIEGYVTGLMPETYSEILTEQDVADLISFLLEIE